MSRCACLCAVVWMCALAGCRSTQPAGVAGADVAPAEEAAVLDAVDRVLLAMRDRDTEAYAASLTPDGMTYSQRFTDGNWRLRARTNREDIELLGEGTDVYEERYWEPTVLIRGPMALVWAPYEFRINGAVSHCGVDVFEMLKLDGQWVMGNAMWTVEPGACDELRPGPGAEIRPPAR